MELERSPDVWISLATTPKVAGGGLDVAVPDEVGGLVHGNATFDEARHPPFSTEVPAVVDAVLGEQFLDALVRLR